MIGIDAAARPGWIGGAVAVVLAIAAGIADWRRSRRADLDRIGVLDWRTVQVLCLIVAAMLGAVALNP